ncbi:MAG: J domain-containing protein [Clostridia bacterium]|nr:J domain-containing protein [Clostridia bacterium]
MNDPYKVLGVSRDATDDEIKAAYRELAKKYHPDNYADNPLADLVEEKMKEVNEAYDTIRKERAAGRSSSGSGGSYGGSYNGYTGGLGNIRTLISNGRYSEAELMLDSIAASERGAEWNYLKGCVLMQRGAFYDAQRHIDTACYMDPNNEEYRRAKDSIRNYSAGAGRQYRSAGSGSNDMCDLCSTLICMDCMCECCGGDLIRCC